MATRHHLLERSAALPPCPSSSALIALRYAAPNNSAIRVSGNVKGRSLQEFLFLPKHQIWLVYSRHIGAVRWWWLSATGRPDGWVHQTWWSVRCTAACLDVLKPRWRTRLHRWVCSYTFIPWISGYLAVFAVHERLWRRPPRSRFHERSLVFNEAKLIQVWFKSAVRFETSTASHSVADFAWTSQPGGQWKLFLAARLV